jgi:hypothetical protein
MTKDPVQIEGGPPPLQGLPRGIGKLSVLKASQTLWLVGKGLSELWGWVLHLILPHFLAVAFPLRTQRKARFTTLRH